MGKYSRFKKRGISDSFAYRTKPKFKVDGRNLKIERLDAIIKMRERLRFDGVVCQATISTRAGKWFVSIMIKLSANPYTNKSTSSENQVGVDLGIKELATLSDGTVFPSSQPLKASMKKLAKLQRKLGERVRGSNRYNKLKGKIGDLHFRISCQRSATLHELSDHLTANFGRIVIEDLNVEGMVKNHNLSRAISDCGWGEFRRQVEYKSLIRGRDIVVADRWFPSSKMCSNCGSVKSDLTLAGRIYKCDCGLEICRDFNASKNLMNYVETDQSSTKIPT